MLTTDVKKIVVLKGDLKGSNMLITNVELKGGASNKNKVVARREEQEQS